MTKPAHFYRKLNLLSILAISGCNYHIDNRPVDLTPNYENVQRFVLEPYCVRCHAEFRASLEVAKRATDICAALQENYMPPSGARPSSALVKMVCDWVEE